MYKLALLRTLVRIADGAGGFARPGADERHVDLPLGLVALSTCPPVRTEHIGHIVSNPKVGASWEGLVVQQIAQLLAASPEQCFHWSTHSGAKLDLLVVAGNRRLGFEVKRAEAPRPTPSMRSAFETLGLHRLDVVHAGTESYAMAPGNQGAAGGPPGHGASTASGVRSTSPFRAAAPERLCPPTASFPKPNVPAISARKFHRFAKRGRGDGCFRKANASQGAQAYLTGTSSTRAAFNAAKTVSSASAAGNR